MDIIKSFVLTPALPQSANDPCLFEKALSVLKERNITTVEFYTDLDKAREYRPLLDHYGFDGVFLAAALQKRNKIDLCTTDELARKEAVNKTLKYAEAAKQAGASGLLITSGRYPGKKDELLSWNNLKKSICELIQKANNLRITMEPGDREVDACQLAGPTQETIEFAKEIRSINSNFWLTMDISHLAQLREGVEEALKLAEPYCEHIHLANCILKKDSPLYGDKHPFFTHPNAVYTLDNIKEILNKTLSIYKMPLRVSVEIINREEDEWRGFLSILEEEEWFFEN